MEEDFDIYEDLDFGKKKHEENCQAYKDNEELLNKVEKLEERIKNLETELSNEKNQRKLVDIHFSSLLLTAKNELARKDSQIADLRAQIDNFYFRRNKVRTQKDDSTKNNTYNSEVKKDPESTRKCQVEEKSTPKYQVKEKFTSKCQVEEKQEKINNFDKSLLVYFSPGPQLLSRFGSLSDDENTEVTCQPNQLTSTVFGERLKKRLKDQEEKERLEMEQAKLLTSVPKNNEIVDTKTEVKTTNINNIDNKENQYRLRPLDISPKKNLKRGNEDKINEVFDKQRKYFEHSKASQSCKSEKIDNAENSGSCTDKFVNTNVHTGEYFCSADSRNNPLEDVDKHRKKSSKSPEYDKRVHSSRNVNEQRDDRYDKKYKDNEYRDNRSKSRSRISPGSEKSYSCIDRGRSRGRSSYHDGRGRKNYYNREDDFNRNRSRSRLDLRNHIRQWKNNEVAYENNITERRYPDEKVCGEVRRSRRIEARSHSRHTGYKEDNNYHNRDDYKGRQYEEKNRRRRRSRSRRSHERNSADSTSSRKNDSGRTDSAKEDRVELNEGLEEGEILDDAVTEEEMNIINNIFEGNDEPIQNNVLNPGFQSPGEERIENIQEFIQGFDTKKEAVKADDKNLKKNIDRSTDIMLNINDSKNSHQNRRDKSEEKKKEIVQKVNVDQQLTNTEVKNIKKIYQQKNDKNEKIVTPKKEQSQDSKFEQPSKNNAKPISNNVELKENKCDINKAKIIENNEDQNNLDKQSEAITNSTKSTESTIKQKPKIVKVDDFPSTSDPESCKRLLQYLKKKPELHNNTSSETSISHVNKSDTENTQDKIETNTKVVHSKPVENSKSEQCKKEEPPKAESDKCVKINTSEKSEESSSSSTSSALKIVCEPEPIADSVNEKAKNNECFVSPIPKNPVKRTASKNKINVKKPSTSTGSEAKKVVASRKKKEKVDEKQNSNNRKGHMILITKRRPVQLSNFSSE